MTPEIQDTVAAAASKVTGAASATTLVGWATGSDFGMWAGIVIGLVGLIINLYYKRKSDRRSMEAHKIFISRHGSNNWPVSFPPIQEHDGAEDEKKS